MPGAGDLLGLLRQGKTLTRAQIVAASGRARATVSNQLDALISAGYVVSAAGQRSTGGRPAEVLALNAELGALLIADVGSSHARLGIADLDGRILAIRDHDIDIDDGPAVVLGLIDRVFDELVAAVDTEPAAVLGLAIGVPGPVEYATGRLVSPRTMRGWDGVSVPEHFAARASGALSVDKDANIMALGVHRALGAEADDAVVLKVGMGIGAGIISRGAILRGAHGAAGDLGHIPRPGGPLCRCGQYGCAEASAGGWAIARRLRELGHDSVRSSADVVELARARDPDALLLLREAGRRIGETVVDAVGLLNPGLVVVGGNLAEADDVLMAGIRERIYERSHPLATRRLQVMTSPLGADAGLIGAAQLAADTVLQPARVSALLESRGHPVSAALDQPLDMTNPRHK